MITPPRDAPADDLRTENVTACPACGSRVRTPWRRGCRDWQQPHAPGRYSYSRCRDCGARYLDARPVEEELGEVYFEGYGPYQADPQFTPTPPGVAAKVAALPSRAAAGALEIVWRDRVAAALDDFYAAPAGGALLDYGCGSTAFLDRAAAAGWRTVGADFSSAIVDAVATHGHRAVLVGASFDAEVEDASIDRARMNHVIEHLYDPGAALRAIHTKLKPGGLIHIATPNPEAFGSALFGTRWFALDCPRHAIMFPPHALSRLSVACGFSDPVVLHEVGPKDLSRSIGIVRYERGRLAHEQIAGLAAERYRAMALALPSKVAALAGRADRFHLLARA